MRIAAWAGRISYWRGKGAVWLELIRPWVLPALGGGAALKYLGVPTGRAVAAMVAVAVVTEAAAILLGWLEHRSGATAEHYRQAAETDPYKADSLALTRELLAEVRCISRRLREWRDPTP